MPMHTTDQNGACTCRRVDCASPAKHPRIRWEGSMSERADEGVIRSWWQRWPGANVGVVTGSVSGVVVIDVDPRNGGEETLFGLQADHEGLPRHWRARPGVVAGTCGTQHRRMRSHLESWDQGSSSRRSGASS